MQLNQVQGVNNMILFLRVVVNSYVNFPILLFRSEEQGTFNLPI